MGEGGRDGGGGGGGRDGGGGGEGDGKRGEGDGNGGRLEAILVAGLQVLAGAVEELQVAEEIHGPVRGLGVRLGKREEDFVDEEDEEGGGQDAPHSWCRGRPPHRSGPDRQARQPWQAVHVSTKGERREREK